MHDSDLDVCVPASSIDDGSQSHRVISLGQQQKPKQRPHQQQQQQQSSLSLGAGASSWGSHASSACSTDDAGVLEIMRRRQELRSSGSKTIGLSGVHNSDGRAAAKGERSSAVAAGSAPQQRRAKRKSSDSRQSINEIDSDDDYSDEVIGKAEYRDKQDDCRRGSPPRRRRRASTVAADPCVVDLTFSGGQDRSLSMDNTLVKAASSRSERASELEPRQHKQTWQLQYSTADAQVEQQHSTSDAQSQQQQHSTPDSRRPELKLWLDSQQAQQPALSPPPANQEGLVATLDVQRLDDPHISSGASSIVDEKRLQPSFMLHAAETLADTSGDAMLARQLQEVEHGVRPLAARSVVTRQRTRARRESIPSMGGTKRVGPSPVIVTFPWNAQGEPVRGAIPVTQSDLDLLNPQLHLNDSLIEFYLRYIREEVLDVANRNRFHFFSPFFFTTLSSPVGGAERVRRWVRGIDIFEKDFIVVPVNDRDHWKVIVMCRVGAALRAAASAQQKRALRTISLDMGGNDCLSETPRGGPSKSCLLMFDSLGMPHEKHFTCLRRWLAQEYAHRFPRDDGEPCLKQGFGPAALRGIALQAPVQTNDFDCGVYLLHNMETFCRDPDISLDEITPEWFDVETIDEKRAQIFTVIDRLRHELALLKEALSGSRSESQ